MKSVQCTIHCVVETLSYESRVSDEIEDFRRTCESTRVSKISGKTAALWNRQDLIVSRVSGVKRLLALLEVKEVSRMSRVKEVSTVPWVEEVSGVLCVG